MPIARKNKKKAKAKRKLARKTNAQIKKQIREGKQLRRKMINTLDKALKKPGSSLVVKTKTNTFRPTSMKKLGEVLENLHAKDSKNLKQVSFTTQGVFRDTLIGYLVSGQFQGYVEASIIDRTQDFVDTSQVEAQMGTVMVDKVDQIMGRVEAITQMAIEQGKTDVMGWDDALAIGLVVYTGYAMYKALDRPRAVREKAERDKKKKEEEEKKKQEKLEKKKGSGIFLPPIILDYLQANKTKNYAKDILALNNSLMKTVKPSMFQPRF